MSNLGARRHVEVPVLDVMMPSMRGDKLAALLGKSAALSKLGVVLISSLPEAEVTPLMALGHVDAFVRKENVRLELVAVVAKLASR